MISAEKATGFPVSVACALLGVSRSAFYEWARGAPSDLELTDAWLLEQIKAIHAQHRGVYGGLVLGTDTILSRLHGASGQVSTKPGELQ